eukprot:TRINITY_DN805_c0_g1_i2.p1 TRINITY_DN805_c0_g1~~TRINITY_DN805_c0_g1_i2.p1  ORF type:complete len:477 (-),score=45.88 TRINITY_DN805_c0_g1_i2:141-1571(-)
MNGCKQHENAELEQYCVNCKQLMCIFCSAEHIKKNPKHTTEFIFYYVLQATSIAKQTNLSSVSADLSLVEIKDIEAKLEKREDQLKEVAENMKATFMKALDEWLAPHLHKLEGMFKECAKFRSSTSTLVDLAQKNEKFIKDVESFYMDKMHQDVINISEEVKENKNKIAELKEIRSNVIQLQDECNKLKVIDIKKRTPMIQKNITKILKDIKPLLIKVICESCNKKIEEKSQSPDSCSICQSKKEEKKFCQDCMKNCKGCASCVCKKCMMICEICANSVCLKCMKEGEKIKSRICCKDELMKKERWEQLASLSGKKLTRKALLYKGTIDGFTRSSFHSKSDGKGPTVTVVKSEFGEIFGGYISQSWGINKKRCNDENAFVFSITRNRIYPRKRDVSHYDNNVYGPWFGACYFGIGYGRDNWDTDSTACIDNSSIENDFFEVSNPRISGSNTENFKVKEIEVYEVSIQLTRYQQLHS